MLLGCLGLFAASTAGAQTTSTSALDSTSTSITTTTIITTTSTAPANPCVGQPCLPEPPAAFLAVNGAEFRLGLADSCWRDATPTGQTRCTTAIVVLPAVVVRSGDALSLRFATDLSPTSASLSVGGNVTPLVAGNPIALGGDFPIGTNIVNISTGWLQGDARYRVTLDVLPAVSPPAVSPPAASEPRTLALTG